MIRVLFFGELRDMAGMAEWNSDSPDLDALKLEIFTRWPEMKHKTLAFAINKNLVHENQNFMQNDEVAIMPPFSGG